MICKHCHEEVTQFTACCKVIEKIDVTLADGKAFVQNGYTIEHPRGKQSYDFRCICGGDLNDKYNECLSYLKGRR